MQNIHLSKHDKLLNLALIKTLF